MAIKGDLQYMSLANLVQMVCLDRRKAMLTLQHRHAGEGVIFFSAGQIIHAEAGVLTGAEAVYHLLSWPDGTFEMKDYTTIPAQTVTVSWNHLLMEGLRLLDEQTVGAAIQQIESEQTLSLPEIEQDSDLEDDLILVLSRLEQIQAQLKDKKIRKQPVQALQLLTGLVNEVATFAQTLPGQVSTLDYLADALAKAGEVYPAARLLRIQNTHLSSDIIAQLYHSWNGNSAERRATFTELGESMPAILETYFAYFVGCFHASRTAGQWRETCEIFLAELRDNIKQVQF